MGKIIKLDQHITNMTVITTNFLIEFLVSSLLSPTLNTLVKVLSRRSNLGFNNDFVDFEEEKEVVLN